MSFICIENNGVASKEGMRLMGASSKDASKIGTFGTGWKYGLAGAVRLAGACTVMLGESQIDVGLEPVHFRGATHDALVLHQEGRETLPLNITTQLGKGWEPWMTLREFISNAIDEGGHKVYLAERIQGAHDKTRVFIPAGPFMDAFNHINDHFCLTPVEGEIICPNGRAMPKADPNRCRIFKKGVLVRTGIEDAAFDYEINNVELGEDRIAKEIWSALWDLIDSAPIEVKRAVITHSFEGCAASYAAHNKSSQWREVFGNRLVVSSSVGAPDELIVNYAFVNLAEQIGCRTLNSDLAAKAAQRETMPATFTVRECCKKLERIGIKINPMLVLMSKLEGDDILLEGGLIYIKKDLNAEGIMEALILAGTIGSNGYIGGRSQCRTMAAVIRSMLK